MKKLRVFGIVVFGILFCVTSAFPNGLNLNSLGTKALTMGGAFVGLADDFSAIFWNPAGMALFKQKQFGFYGTDIIPSGSYQFDMPTPVGPITLVDAETVTKHYLGGMAAYAHPISENVVAGIGVYTPAGLGAEWNGTEFALIANNNPSLEWKSRIGLVTIAPALAFKISDQVFFGAALNINYGVFDVSFHAGSAEVAIPVPPFAMEVDLGQYTEEMSGWGFGATFGILIKPSEMFSAGATVRTPSKVSFNGDATISGLSTLGSMMGVSINSTTDLDRDVTWPLWLAVGVALHPVESLTLTADVQYTQWSKIDKIVTDYKDPFWQALMAVSGDDERPMHWDDATQIRFGAEYRLGTLAFRGGYYIDPSPAPDRTMNVLLPNYDFNVITAGFGYGMDGLRIDFGIEYLIGKERNVDFLKTLTDPDWESAMPGTYNMKLLVPNLSISYSF